MNSSLQITDTALALGDPLCRTLCVSLSDGRAKTANELARAAGVAAPRASENLERLVISGIVCADSHRRRRYYRIPTTRLAEVTAALGEVATLAPSPRKVPSSVPVKLRTGRTCYDHLAGPVAVGICEALENEAVIVRDGAEYRLGPGGAEWIRKSGIDIGKGPGARTFARCCLDWSERRPHLGGALGEAILRRLVDARLAVRGEGRQMSVSSLESVLENLQCRPPA